MLQRFKIPSNPKLEVDIEGNVYRVATSKRLSPWTDKDGYLRVKCVDGYVACHRAVAEVFCKNPNPKEFTIVNHLDSNPANNNPDNLEWTSHSLNNSHKHARNRAKFGENHAYNRLKELDVIRVCELLNLGYAVPCTSKLTGVDTYNIYNIIKGRSWRHISILYRFVKSPERDGLTDSAKTWIKDQVKRGRTKEEILSMCKNLDNKLVVTYLESNLSIDCNDYP